tara:strand:+ start:427 stop:759 length:333 start_codon:yes stop_codon:yes gene_type:complete
MARTSNSRGVSSFKMKSGNSPIFKEMGSNDIVEQTRTEADASIVDAAKTKQTVEPIDFKIDVPEIKIADSKKKEKKKDKEKEDEENEEENGDNGKDNKEKDKKKKSKKTD